MLAAGSGTRIALAVRHDLPDSWHSTEAATAPADAIGGASRAVPPRLDERLFALVGGKSNGLWGRVTDLAMAGSAEFRIAATRQLAYLPPP
jgi:hypothetical protein